MRKTLAIALASILAAGLLTSVSAQDSSQDSTVELNVSDTVQLDARPSTLSYGDGSGDSGIEPGALQTTSDDGFGHIDIENIGSVPIEQIHAQATMHAAQPFGSTGEDAGTQFDTGNFFVMSTDTAQDEYTLGDAIKGPDNMHYLNRVEYAEENEPEYIVTEDETSDDDGITTVEGTDLISSTPYNVDVGRFRVGEVEYFWVLYTAGETSTGSDTWALRIGETPHTPNELGTIDFSDNDSNNPDYIEYTNSDATSNSGADGSVITGQQLVSFDTSNPEGNGFDGQPLLDGGGLNDSAGADAGVNAVDSSETRTYNFYVDRSAAQTQIIRSSFNTETQSPQESGDSPEWTADEVNSGGQQPIFVTDGDGDRLQPGQNFPIDVGVQLPNGVDRSRITSGQVSILATEESSLVGN